MLEEQYSGLWINPSSPEEIVDIRYITKYNEGEDWILVNTRLNVNGNFKWGTAFSKFNKQSKQQSLVLEHILEDEIVSWGNIWLHPTGFSGLTIQILANPVYRPPSLFTKVQP